MCLVQISICDYCWSTTGHTCEYCFSSDFLHVNLFISILHHVTQPCSVIYNFITSICFLVSTSTRTSSRLLSAAVPVFASRWQQALIFAPSHTAAANDGTKLLLAENIAPFLCPLTATVFRDTVLCHASNESYHKLQSIKSIFFFILS